ncbi:MAG: C4-type zinc ribbon domain-containing protein [Vicinamibacterales bacterium]|nr:C4-type zinc ribbon domain-containing protein [Vicinamibacterales bacterium]
MLPDLERLIRLQSVDSTADDARRRIGEAPGRVGALDSRLDAARAAVEAAKQALAENQTERRTLEKDCAVVQQRVTKYKDQLMEVKTNREYHAIQHEIETFTGEVQKVEGQILEKMMAHDELTVALKDAEAALARDIKALGDEKAAIEQEARDLAVVVEQMTAERAAIAATVEPRTLALFDTVYKRRQGIAVSKVTGGLCEACHVRVRPQVLNNLLMGQTLFQCESCQRILYAVATKPAESTGGAGAGDQESGTRGQDQPAADSSSS